MKTNKSLQNEQKIKELEKKIEELDDSWKRALADYQNLERRVSEEKQEFAKYAKSSLIRNLLPFIDSLNKASQHINDQGLKLSMKSLHKTLNEEGLTEIEAINHEFDPHTMQAIDIVEGSKEGIVAEVLQKGYKLYDKIIRPAQVKVTKVTNKEE